MQSSVYAWMIVLVYTQAETLDALRQMAVDAVRCHFDEAEMPRLIRLHLVREELVQELWGRR